MMRENPANGCRGEAENGREFIWRNIKKNTQSVQ